MAFPGTGRRVALTLFAIGALLLHLTRQGGSPRQLCFIVPLRGRDLQADVFRTFLRGRLEQEKSKYKLVFVRQTFDESFNRGMLINLGFLFLKGKYTCSYIYLHDVDMLPHSVLRYSPNMSESCAGCVRHLAANASQFNYRLPYPLYFSGILGMHPLVFYRLGGFSNQFWGWGAEDDDFRGRLMHLGGRIIQPTNGWVLSIAEGHTQRDMSNSKTNKQLLRNESIRRKRRGNDLEVLRSVLRKSKHSWEIKSIDENTVRLTCRLRKYMF